MKPGLATITWRTPSRGRRAIVSIVAGRSQRSGPNFDWNVERHGTFTPRSARRAAIARAVASHSAAYRAGWWGRLSGSPCQEKTSMSASPSSKAFAMRVTCQSTYPGSSGHDLAARTRGTRPKRSRETFNAASSLSATDPTVAGANCGYVGSTVISSRREAISANVSTKLGLPYWYPTRTSQSGRSSASLATCPSVITRRGEPSAQMSSYCSSTLPGRRLRIGPRSTGCHRKSGRSTTRLSERNSPRNSAIARVLASVGVPKATTITPSRVTPDFGEFSRI